MDIRLMKFSFLIVICVILHYTESRGCSPLTCLNNNQRTCIESETGTVYCNNCTTNNKVGLNCNINNPCLFNARCSVDYCAVVNTQGGTTSTKCLQNACDNQPCLNEGLCTPTEEGGFNCVCVNQWKGPKCDEDVDECESNPCKNSGTCENRSGGFICFCMAGFSGSRCEINDDDCQGNPCFNNGTCEDLVASYKCRCPPTKAGLRCQLDDPCISSPCGHGSSCSASPSGNYSCNCQSGWKGLNCDEDIDECSEAPKDICEQGGTCTNTFGSFKCLCPVGLSGDRCEVTLDHCHPNLCKNGGTCVSKQGKYECFCLSGFSGDTCNESDVCQGVDCNGAGCIFVDGQYRCICPSDTTGQYCEFDLNGRCLRESCMNENCNKCQNGAKCSIKNPSTCDCLPGYHGDLCQFRNLCLSDPCKNGGVCSFNDKNGFTCQCPLSFTGDLCQQYMDDCSSRPCLNGGICTIEGNTRKCKCQPGHSGNSCEWSEDPCSLSASPCLNGASCTADIFGRYTCQCRSGYSGNNCEKYSPCGATRPCSNGGTCTDVQAGTFVCQCTGQWKGLNCTTPACDNCKCCKNSDVCQDICDLEECRSVNKECKNLENIKDPYHSCPLGNSCSLLFKNERCDKECDTEECLYDGFDCKSKSISCPNETYCRPVFEDGHCDKQCYNSMCMWDGTDCDLEKQTIQGVIIIKLFVQRAEFEKNLMKFLYDLSHQLTCVVKLSKDGLPAVSDVDIPGYGEGVEVRLKLVYTSDQNTCFKYIGSAGEFIKKVNQNQTGTDFPMYDISTAPDSSTATSNQTPIYIIIGAIFCPLVVLLLVGIWMKKRKKVDKTWFPPGFSRGNKTCIRSSTDQMSSGSEKQIIEGSDSFSEESFYTGTLSKISKVEFPGDIMNTTITSNQSKIPHIPPNMCAPPAASSSSSSAAVYHHHHHHNHHQHQMNNYLASSFRPQVPQDDIFSKIINEAMCNYDQTGETPLHLAARYSRADAAQKFLEDGADPNAQDHDGKTPLHAAIAADAVGVFQILLRCRTCSVNVQAKDGTTPLICAVRLAVDGMVGDLIKAEADLNKTDDQGKTGLHWAAAVNNLDAAILLLHHGGINRDVQDDKGQTPLFLAAKEGSSDVAQLLLHNSASMDLADQLDRLPRDIAIEKKHYDIVKLLDEYLAKASQNRGQSNFSDHLLMSEGAKGMKQKYKSLPQSEADGRNKKKRKIDMIDVLSEATQGEMFAANFYQTPHHFEAAPYGYMGGPSNAADSKQMYNHVLQWNKHNQNDFMLKENIRMKNHKGLRRNDKWFIGSTGSSPSDSDFAVIQSPNEGSSGSPGYCNNGGVFLSPPEADHYQQHMLAANDGGPKCVPASVIQRYHANPIKNSRLMQTSYGQYDETFQDRAAFSKPSSTSAALHGKQNHQHIFQQYPTPPSQQFSPNGISSSSAQASCLNTTQRENLFETPSPGAGDQWVDVSMTTCMEAHPRQQLDNMVSNESSVC